LGEKMAQPLKKVGPYVEVETGFLPQIFSNYVGQLTKFCGSPWQIFHIQYLIYYGPLNPTKYAVFVTGKN